MQYEEPTVLSIFLLLAGMALPGMLPFAALLAVVLLSLDSSSLREVTATAPLVGGAGLARYFRGVPSSADIASARMNLPFPAATFELWVSPPTGRPSAAATMLVAQTWTSREIV